MVTLLLTHDNNEVWDVPEPQEYVRDVNRFVLDLLKPVGFGVLLAYQTGVRAGISDVGAAFVEDPQIQKGLGSCLKAFQNVVNFILADQVFVPRGGRDEL